LAAIRAIDPDARARLNSFTFSVVDVGERVRGVVTRRKPSAIRDLPLESRRAYNSARILDRDTRRAANFVDNLAISIGRDFDLLIAADADAARSDRAVVRRDLARSESAARPVPMWLRIYNTYAAAVLTLTRLSAASVVPVIVVRARRVRRLC